MPQTITIQSHHIQKRRLPPRIDFGELFAGFFAFFGVSGVDHGREERINRRFDLEYFPHIVTLTLNTALPDGTYHLAGLPERVNRRGWVTKGQQAVTTLSDEGLAEFQDWLAQGRMTVEARLAPPAEQPTNK